MFRIDFMVFKQDHIKLCFIISSGGLLLIYSTAQCLHRINQQIFSFETFKHFKQFETNQ